jgi:predicted acetyltransferase
MLGGYQKFALRKPASELAASFERMRDAVLAAGEHAWNGHGTEIALTDVHQYISATSDWAAGRRVPRDWVPTSTYWVVEGADVVGEVEVRHRLLPRLRIMGGHIGYHTHPAHRGKGVATYALGEALRILREMGVRAALITCGESNAASARVIEKCGGARVRDALVEGFEPRRRYVVPLYAQDDFGDFADLRI